MSRAPARPARAPLMCIARHARDPQVSCVRRGPGIRRVGWRLPRCRGSSSSSSAAGPSRACTGSAGGYVRGEATTPTRRVETGYQSHRLRCLRWVRGAHRIRARARPACDTRQNSSSWARSTMRLKGAASGIVANGDNHRTTRPAGRIVWVRA